MSEYLRSSIKRSFDLRKHKSVLGIRKCFDLKSLTFSGISTTHGVSRIEQSLESSNSLEDGTIGFICLQLFLSSQFFEAKLTVLKQARYKSKSSGIQM